MFQRKCVVVLPGNCYQTGTAAAAVSQTCTLIVSVSHKYTVIHNIHLVLMWTLWQMFHGTKYASIPRNRIWTVPKRYLMSQVYILMCVCVCVWTSPNLFSYSKEERRKKHLHTKRLWLKTMTIEKKNQRLSNEMMFSTLRYIIIL